jgi:hypothetical protein
MDEETLARNIRTSWARWLNDAEDSAVIRFHRQVIDLLETEGAGDLAFGRGVFSQQLLEDAIEAPDLEFRKPGTTPSA